VVWALQEARSIECPVQEEVVNELTERKDSYLRIMEKIPTQGYLGLALGSIAASAVLRLAGKKEAALFVGQWPPTFLLFALAHKLLQPSQEHGSLTTREAVRQASQMASGDPPPSASSLSPQTPPHQVYGQRS
jgi:hypothetical protein